MRCILMGVTRHIEKNTPEREETAVQAMCCILMGVNPSHKIKIKANNDKLKVKKNQA